MTEIIKFEQGSWPRKCRNLWAILTCLVWLFLPGCTTDIPDDVAEAYRNLGTIDFNSQVKPILSDKCFQCHGPDQAKQKAGLRLDVAASAYDELPDNPGKFAIKPGNLQKSELFHRIVSNDPDYMMPAPESNLNLSAREKAVLIKWIEQQAVYQPHWAFIKPKQVSPPEVLHKDWAVTPIDRFVLQQMEERQLKPTEQAPKDLLLRRLSLDLTGLAPTIDEIKAFEQDLSEDAYEKQVDRLLASPHYGEKMAMDWMDLARYADTHGYQVDRYRDMSPWRDWVIKAFNQNMSYDEFVTWQLAGDLLPNPTREQILATGFNRLHPQNLEGGIVDEEFRVAYVSDRTDVLGQGLMGLTLACAKCHDHKFDPISQENYYQLYSFFNNVNESGQISWEGATPVPTLLLPTDQQEEILEYLEKKTRESEKNLQNVTDKINQQFERWVQSQSYHKLKDNRFPGEPVAHFEFENDLNNSVYPEQQAKMDRMFSSGETPVYTKGYQGQGILLDGDAWIDLKNIGRFRRSQPFSVGLNIFIPHDLENGVLFHKGNGARIYNFRGYHLALKNNHLELLMAHTWPDNAIVEYTTNEVPKDTWLQLTVTYDGSSKASGFRVYLDGEELATQVEVDNLYKDIIFSSSKHDGYANPDEPGLQIGARWRGKGLGGATVDNIVVYQRELAPLEVKQLAAPEQFRNVVAMASNQLGDQHQELLKTYYLNNYSPDYKLAVKRLTHDREVLSDSMERVKEIMVMKEMAQPRKSYVLERGLYNSYGQQVTPNTPQSILKMPEDFPKNRMGLAQWITHPDHPLTARVAVNRYWQNYFGTGLVKTTEDFGNQGDLPSHPQLLDWLALEFIKSGWDIKALQKLIVMSATYRQSSLTSDTLRSLDPENTWLSRGPTVRLSSELIRDNALMASGLINYTIGGESVRPYQPEGLWKTNNDVYHQDSGDKLYRRSLYVIWKRTVPHPTLATFDQPERSECTVRRQKTNTPLQALVLLNDPAYIEVSRAIGEGITRANSLEEGTTRAFYRLTGRPPLTKELEILLALQMHELEKFRQNPEKVKGWLELGQYRVDSNLDPAIVAANSVLASAIINSDAAITKR